MVQTPFWGCRVANRERLSLQRGLGPADLRDEMARVTEKVQSIADSFPLPEYTRPASEALGKAEERSRPYLREVERFERYR